jgi:hypothetical protein
LILKTQFNSKWPLFPEDEVVATVEVVEVVASEVVVTAVDVEVASVEAVVTVAVAAVLSVVIAPDLDNLSAPWLTTFKVVAVELLVAEAVVAHLVEDEAVAVVHLAVPGAARR